MFLKIFLLGVSLQVSLAKEFDKCDLANQLLHKYKFPRDQISTWICIVKHESEFKTDAFNPNTKDYGLFQISQIYWCDPPEGPNHPDGCHVPCKALQDDDIGNDVACVRKVFDDTSKQGKNGFSAWTTYPKYCNRDTQSYINGCKL